MIIDLYMLVKDLIDEAKEQKNIALVEKLLDIKIAISELEDENRDLKKRLELQQNVIRHNDGPYITIKNDPQGIKYCSTCWGNSNKLIQLEENNGLPSSYPKCPICLTNLLQARNSSK